MTLIRQILHLKSILEWKYKSIILTNFFSKRYEESILSLDEITSVMANIEEIYQRSLFFFFFDERIVGFSIDIQLAVSSRPIYPRYDLNWIFSKAPSRVNFHPFAGLSPPIDWPSSRNCRKIDTPTDKIADYRVGDRRKEEIVDYQFSICIGIFFPIEIRSR